MIFEYNLDDILQLNKIFQNLSLVTKEGSIVYFKHRSFFSYLGPHRYSSTAIPWGHVLLNDGEMKRYVKIFHKGREKQFLKFFYSGLAYPRFTVNEMIEIAQNNGFGVFWKFRRRSGRGRDQDGTCLPPA